MPGTPQFAVFIATSLDGFIARPDGGLDWLPSHDPADDYGYQDFMAGIDALVMGRKTFETVVGFGGAWPFEGKRVLVLSSKELAIPEELVGRVEPTMGSPVEIAEQLGAQGVGRVYVDGGQTIQGFLRAGLIHEITLSRVPVLLGKGIPLFGALDHDIVLDHLETRAYDSGLVQGRYRVRRG